MEAKKSPARQQGHKAQHKDKHSITQMEEVYDNFHDYPKTMLQVSVITGILRANICRYVRTLRNNGLIQVVRKGRCPHTHCTAGFLSTDRKLFNQTANRQLNLFDNEKSI